MRKIWIATIVISMAAVMLLLGGCGQQATATLEDIAADNPDIVTAIQENLTTPEAMTSEVSFSGDSFDITYKFKDPIDDADEKVLVESFSKNSDTLKEGFEKALTDLETQTGITGITGTIHIFNASGEETWTHEFPEK
ncbi:MAG: DUF4854 domain-containing protein [Clostridiales bacterium]|nr:DUF4854 domain-containing protein [Clostridiales bacterium]